MKGDFVKNYWKSWVTLNIGLRSRRIRRWVRESRRIHWRSASYGTCRGYFMILMTIFCNLFYASAYRNKMRGCIWTAFSRCDWIKALYKRRKMCRARSAKYFFRKKNILVTLSLALCWCLRQLPGLERKEHCFKIPLCWRKPTTVTFL